MITLWGNADSVNVQKVMWCCEEASIPYRRIDAGRHFKGLDTPEFLARNPNGLVPTIDDGGLVVWESNAIVRYLAARYAKGFLWPEEPGARSQADRWMDWANGDLWPALRPLFRAHFRTAERDRNAAAIAEAHAAVVALLRILDTHLAKNVYVGGATETMGDIALGPPAWRWFALPIERPALPHLQRWFEALSARETYRRTVMVPLS